MPSKRKFYRNVYKVEVLSTDPMACSNLREINNVVTYGDATGRLSTEVTNEVVDGPATARLLMAQGSDPILFYLTEDGEDSEDYQGDV